MVNNELVIVMKPVARRSLQVYCVLSGSEGCYTVEGHNSYTCMSSTTGSLSVPKEALPCQRKHVLAKGSMSLQKEIPLGSVVL